MYEIDGIVYAGNPRAMKKIIFAEYLGGHALRVAYSTGEVVDVDFSQDFDGPAFEPLRDEAVLRNFAIEHGALTWLDGEIDVAPEYLLEVGKTVELAVPE